MKSLFLVAILTVFSLSTFASDNSNPINFDKMLSVLSQVNDPRDAIGKSFQLGTPVGYENNTLHVLPESAVDIKDIGHGFYNVKILNAEPFYDMDFYNENGLVSLNKIEYSWENGKKINATGIANQECVNHLKFQIGGKILSQADLEKYKASNTIYKFEFDKSILKESKDDEFTFTRLNNEIANVSLSIYKKDGTLFTKITSSPIATCDIAEAKQEPSKATWSTWSKWNTCSTSCGGGKQERTRLCLSENEGLTCDGNATEVQSCNTQACEIKPANYYISESIDNVVWRRVGNTTGTYNANYAITYENTNANKSLNCKVFIKGVSVTGTTVTAVLSSNEENFTIAPGQEKTIKGDIQIKLMSSGPHTGIRTKFSCRYTDGTMPTVIGND